MKKNLTAIIAAMALCTSGCAPIVKPMMTPTGKQGFSVSCDGSADSWSSCYQAATQACKGKYVVIDKQQDSTPTAYGPLISRHLVVECPN